MNKRVSIILVNYNGKKFNKDCIDSVLLQSYKNFEIIFVDNSSTDGSVEEVEKIYKQEINDKKIIIVRNKKNTGFTGGNNLGVKYANKKSEYICLLNNDTTVPKNWLEELIKGIESDSKLGAVGSIVLDKGYKEYIRKLYLINNETFVLTILGEIAKNKVSKKEIRKGIYYTSSISGCCFFYKKNIIENPFPEFYFAYGEDVWLSLFIISTGWEMAICSKSIVHHYGSGSFGKRPSDIKLFYGNRNQIINFLVFYKKRTIVKLLPLFLIIQLSQVFINVPVKRIKAKIKGRIRIYKNWNKIKKIRNEIQKKRKISDKKFLNELSYKFSDDIYYANFSKTKKKIINIINLIFKLYYKILNLL